MNDIWKLAVSRVSGHRHSSSAAHGKRRSRIDPLGADKKVGEQFKDAHTPWIAKTRPSNIKPGKVLPETRPLRIYTATERLAMQRRIHGSRNPGKRGLPCRWL